MITKSSISLGLMIFAFCATAYSKDLYTKLKDEFGLQVTIKQKTHFISENRLRSWKLYRLANSVALYERNYPRTLKLHFESPNLIPKDKRALVTDLEMKEIEKNVSLEKSIETSATALKIEKPSVFTGFKNDKEILDDARSEKALEDNVEGKHIILDQSRQK